MAKRRRSLAAGGTNFTGADLTEVRAHLLDWAVQVGSAMGELRKLSGHLNARLSGYSRRNDVQDLLSYGLHEAGMWSAQLRLLHDATAGGVLETHVKAARTLCADAQSLDNACADFKRRHIENEEPTDAEREYLDWVYEDVKGLALDLTDLSNLAAQMDTLVGFVPQGQPVVALIHGIRTDGFWSSVVGPELAASDVGWVKVGYGVFDLLRFLAPLPLIRTMVVRKVATALRHEMKARGLKRISVVAHSFGTYVIGRILRLTETSDIDFDIVVLCGSILPPNFPWEGARSRCTRVVNECGTNDIWPVLAGKLLPIYGPSGTVGFESSTVTLNRYHALKHSGFLTPDFAKANWVPLWEKGAPRRSETGAAREIRLPWGIACVRRVVPPAWLLLLLAGICYWVFGH